MTDSRSRDINSQSSEVIPPSSKEEAHVCCAVTFLWMGQTVILKLVGRALRA